MGNPKTERRKRRLARRKAEYEALQKTIPAPAVVEPSKPEKTKEPH